MKIKVVYTPGGDVNACTIEDIEKHLLEKKLSIIVWGYKKMSYVKYKIRYGRLYAYSSHASHWMSIDRIILNNFSTIEYVEK